MAAMPNRTSGNRWPMAHLTGSACDRKGAQARSALACLEAALSLVDDVDPALAPHQPIVAMPAAQRFQRIADLHGSDPTAPDGAHACSRRRGVRTGARAVNAKRPSQQAPIGVHDRGRMRTALALLSSPDQGRAVAEPYGSLHSHLIVNFTAASGGDAHGARL